MLNKRAANDIEKDPRNLSATYWEGSDLNANKSDCYFALESAKEEAAQSMNAK